MPDQPEVQPATRRDLRLAAAELRRNASLDTDDPDETLDATTEATLVLADDEPIVIDLRDRVPLDAQLERREAAARADRGQRQSMMVGRAPQLLAAIHRDRTDRLP